MTPTVRIYMRFASFELLFWGVQFVILMLWLLVFPTLPVAFQLMSSIARDSDSDSHHGSTSIFPSHIEEMVAMLLVFLFRVRADRRPLQICCPFIGHQTFLLRSIFTTSYRACFWGSMYLQCLEP